MNPRLLAVAEKIELQHGKALVIVGPPASGKSTLARYLKERSAHTVVLFDELPTSHRAWERLKSLITEPGGPIVILTTNVALTEELNDLGLRRFQIVVLSAEEETPNEK